MLELADKEFERVIIAVFYMSKKLSRNVQDILKYPNLTYKDEN